MFIDLSDKKDCCSWWRKYRDQENKDIAAVYKKYYGNCTEIDYGAAGTWQNRLCQSDYTSGKRSDFDMAYMVIAATNDWKLNDEIYRVCKEEGIYVNVADDKSKCDFYFPGIYMKDEVVIGITASGLDHSRAKKSAWQFRKQWRHQMIQTTAKNKVIIGSRESRLAVLQSEMVRDYIKNSIRDWMLKFLQ